MKGFISVLAFVACASATGVSSYGNGVGQAGSPVSLGSSGFGNGIGSDSGHGVQSLSGSIGLTGDSRYGSEIGASQGKTIHRRSIPQSSYGSNSLYGTGLSTGQAVRRVSLTQPSLTPISVQRPSISRGFGLSQGVSHLTVPQSSLVTGRSLGINSAPVRSVSVAPLNYGVSNVKTVRPVSYSQPIVTAQPIRTVKVPTLPIITAQPVRTVKVARQPIVATSPISLSGSSFGSGYGIGQAVHRVTVAQPNLTPVNSGIFSSGISNQVNLRPVSYSQPKVTVQPIRTIQTAYQPIISSSKLNLGGLRSGGIKSNW